MIRFPLIATLFAVLLPAAAMSEMMQQAQVGTVSWRSTPGSGASVAEEIAVLYQTLYNTGSLRVREVPNPEAELIEPLLRQEGVFHGAHFPETLDNVLCDLNPSICTRERIPAERLDSAVGHVGGFEISAPVWRFGKDPALKVVIPDYRLEPFTALRPATVGPDWAPEAAEIAPDADCSEWGMTCAELVVELNPPLLGGQTKADKEVLLPVTGYRTELSLSATSAIATDSKATARLTRAIPLRPEDTTEPEATFAAPPTSNSIWNDKLGATPPADLLENALDKNLLGSGTVKKYAAVSDEPGYADQKTLFELIDHPFINGAELALPYQEPVGIAVLDTDFTPGHCDLHLADDSLSASPAATSPLPCGRLMATPADPTRDHAAHVIGIIAAPINQRGIVGIDPYASIRFMNINPQFRTPEDYSALRAHLVEIRRGKMRVANLSWGVPLDSGSHEDMKSELRALERRTLFVVAAGNEGTEFLPEVCTVVPACLSDLGNVITVAGLNRNSENPDLWQSLDGSSNFGSNVDIGAVAEDVLSTVRDDQIGLMSGTSMAAPQVAGAAALIYSAVEWGYRDRIAAGEGTVSPTVVKSRLIYTSDLFPPLVGRMKGGRLNIERAIDIVPTQLTYIAEDGLHKVKGKLLKRPNDVVLCGTDDDGQEAYKWRAIRRMVYDDFTTRYRIFFNKDEDDRNSPLEQAFCSQLLSQSQTGELQTSEGPVSFRIDQIRDYTSPLFDP